MEITLIRTETWHEPHFFGDNNHRHYSLWLIEIGKMKFFIEVYGHRKGKTYDWNLRSSLEHVPSEYILDSTIRERVREEKDKCDAFAEDVKERAKYYAWLALFRFSEQKRESTLPQKSKKAKQSWLALFGFSDQKRKTALSRESEQIQRPPVDENSFYDLDL